MSNTVSMLNQHYIVGVIIQQELQSMSYSHTMLMVSGDAVFFLQMAPSPSVVDGLSAATIYTVTLTFVFVGGEEGTPVNTSATTRDGGE